VIKLIYVAGPFSAPTRAGVEENIARAAEAGVEVAKLGACPWVPHANTAHPAYETVQPYQFWIDATELQRQKCDAILMIAGWQGSSGARKEHAAALVRGQPVLYSIAELKEWLAYGAVPA
jgi:uncharacterized protein DUF4406